MTVPGGRLPDFIIVGAMKCATSTLHEQLARQPGVYMSTPKEPNFFSDDEEWAQGIDRYCRLFARATDGDLCGESSTHYTKLPTYPQTVDRMRMHLPGTLRLIYVIRDPVERLVSQYIHEWTQRVVHGSIDEALRTNPEMIEYSRYTMQLRPFIETWGHANILPLFFERLTSHPQATLERVCSFIGLQGRPRWDHALGEQNVSRERMRASPWRDALSRFPGMTTFRRTLVPRSWRDRIKSAWMMKDRPRLSKASLERLRCVFDEDLALLGRWLEIDGLSCDTFASIAQAGHPEWRTAVKAPAA